MKRSKPQMGICRTCRAVRVLVGGLCRDCRDKNSTTPAPTQHDNRGSPPMTVYSSRSLLPMLPAINRTPAGLLLLLYS